VLTEIKNRGVQDVCIVVRDGPEGATGRDHHHVGAGGGADLRDPPDPQHLRYSARQDWDAMAKDLRPVYTAVNADQAQARMDNFAEKWQGKYPAAVNLWRSAWNEFIPFLDYDVEIRKIICTTNAIESLNARYRRAVRARGHFPNDAAAMKCLYLVTRSLDPTGRGRARWVIRWKAALNPFAITFDGRINPSIH
jgi:putative transposase